MYLSITIQQLDDHRPKMKNINKCFHNRTLILINYVNILVS